MSLGKPFEAAVHYLPIGGMTYLPYRDKVPMVSGTSVYIYILYKTFDKLRYCYQVVIISPNELVVKPLKFERILR